MALKATTGGWWSLLLPLSLHLSNSITALKKVYKLVKMSFTDPCGGSVVDMAHVLRSRLVMDYATSYFPLIMLGYPQKSAISILALKFTVSPPYYPWVTATVAFLAALLKSIQGCSCALTWSLHLIIFVNNAMRQAHGFVSLIIVIINTLLLLLMQNHVLGWRCIFQVRAQEQPHSER